MTIPRHWTERVRLGDFSAIPVPFAWDQSAEFAHLIDGYDLTGSVEACFRIRERVLPEVQATGWSTASPIDLWIALFMEHRGCRHTGYEPKGERKVALDQLCECLRVQLVTLGPDQRAGILAAMAEPGETVPR
jgi:hypothetical protein